MRLKQSSQMIIFIPLLAWKTHRSHSSVIFPTQEICGVVCIALHFAILCYLMKIYRAVLQLGMNVQQLTEARERRNRERINTSDIADLHIRHATEHDERQR